MNPNQPRAHVEYVCLPEDAPMVLNPARLGFYRHVIFDPTGAGNAACRETTGGGTVDYDSAI